MKKRDRKKKRLRERKRSNERDPRGRKKERGCKRASDREKERGQKRASDRKKRGGRVITVRNGRIHKIRKELKKLEYHWNYTTKQLIRESEREGETK